MKIRSLCATAVVALSLGTAGSAAASSIVYIKNGNVFLTNPTATAGYQVTFDGGWSSPSQADNGTIMAEKDHQVFRMTTSGQLLGSGVDTLYTPGSAYSPFHGPFGPRISPDGSHVAYWGGYDETGSWDGYNWWQLDVSTLWGPTDHFDTPGQTLGQQDYTMPSWIDNGRLLLTNVNTAWDKQVAIYALGGADNTQVQWFTDPNASTLEEGVATRDGSKLAFASGDASSATTNQIRLYTTAGIPSGSAADPLPADPVERCTITATQTDSPSFAPDGGSLVWAEPDGLHVANVASLGDCSGLGDHVIAAGGTQPSWGPADVNLANKPAPPGGGTPGAGSPGAGSGSGSPGTGTKTPSAGTPTGLPARKPTIHHRKRRKHHRKHHSRTRGRARH